MSDYVSTGTWSEVADRLRAAGRIGLVTHRKPDGDALGSVLALRGAMERLGIAADAIFMGPIEAPLRAIAGNTPFIELDEDLPDAEYDVIVVLDTGAWTQLAPLADWLRERREHVIGIDHHARGDDVAPLRVVDVEAAATAEMLVGLLDELGIPIDGAIAEALFVGLATDTGWFRYANADADAFRVSSRLLATGVDKARLYQLIEETFRPARLALEARALGSLEYACAGRVAIQSLSLEDFRATGGRPEELTSLVNRPMIVEQVRVAILLTESEEGVTKISFRAKPAVDGQEESDVNVLAARFGGGGHRFAAGATVNGALDEVRRMLVTVVEETSALRSVD